MCFKWILLGTVKRLMHNLPWFVNVSTNFGLFVHKVIFNPCYVKYSPMKLAKETTCFSNSLTFARRRYTDMKEKAEAITEDVKFVAQRKNCSKRKRFGTDSSKTACELCLLLWFLIWYLKRMLVYCAIFLGKSTRRNKTILLGPIFKS